MRLLTFITLGLLIFSCKEKGTDKQELTNSFDLAKTYKLFESQIKENVDNWNKENNDTLDTRIELDTTFMLMVDKSELLVVLSQYHTKDKRKTYGIVSIENFNKGTIPTFLISDPRANKFYGDSVALTTDSVSIYGRTLLKDGTENFKISFDRHFNGKTFPWNME